MFQKSFIITNYIEYLFFDFVSKVYSVARTMLGFAWQRVGLYVTVRVCISASRCRRPVATGRISSRAAIGPEANLIPSKAG